MCGLVWVSFVGGVLCFGFGLKGSDDDSGGAGGGGDVCGDVGGGESFGRDCNCIVVGHIILLVFG